jgi:hypothetical protein
MVKWRAVVNTTMDIRVARFEALKVLILRIQVVWVVSMSKGY